MRFNYSNVRHRPGVGLRIGEERHNVGFRYFTMVAVVFDGTLQEIATTLLTIVARTQRH